MLGWIIFTAVLLIALAIGTLAWWRIGDQWADAEHKRFTPKNEPPSADGPVVLTRDGRRAGDEHPS
ncbi:MAG: hypothetical protein R3B49_00350 [Phycisphaerales bacterium]